MYEEVKKRRNGIDKAIEKALRTYFPHKESGDYKPTPTDKIANALTIAVAGMNLLAAGEYELAAKCFKRSKKVLEEVHERENSLIGIPPFMKDLLPPGDLTPWTAEDLYRFCERIGRYIGEGEKTRKYGEKR